jgi:thiol-disulfide isomerase/thioredoxin
MNRFDSLKTEQTSSKSFHDFINTSNTNNTLGFFMFYAPWCGHCVKKKKFLNELVNKFGKFVKCHTYNCVALAPTDTFCKKILKFPTMYMVHKGNKYHVTDILDIMIILVAATNSMNIKEVIEAFRTNKFMIDDDKEADIVERLNM